MFDAARHEFRLAQVDDKGVSTRAKLAHSARKSAAARKALQGKPLPLVAHRAWSWFQDLNAGRTGNGFGPNPLSFSEIAAWAGLTGNSPHPFEVRLIKTIDAAYLIESVKPTKTEDAQNG